MLSFEDYVATDAVGWAERARKGEVSLRPVGERADAVQRAKG